MLYKFDTWLLEKIEKFAQWWQKMFGQDNFWWSRCFAVSFTLCCAIYAFAATHNAYPIKNWWIYFYFLLFSIAPNISGVYHYVEYNKQKTYQNLEKGIMNTLKLQLVEMRLLYLFFCPLILSICALLMKLTCRAHISYWLLTLPTISGFAMVFMLYCVSCNPLPPAKSKVKIWLENFVEKAKEFLSPAPQPIPIPISNK